MNKKFEAINSDLVMKSCRNNRYQAAGNESFTVSGWQYDMSVLIFQTTAPEFNIQNTAG